MNVWPAFTDAVTLLLAAVILIMVIALSVQHRTLARLRSADVALSKLKDRNRAMEKEKARLERRLRAVAPRGTVSFQGDRVVLQGEWLFSSGSAEVTEEGKSLMGSMATALRDLLAAESTQMVMVAGHTDDQQIADAPFASNWELSAARALAVMHVMLAGGVPQDRIMAAGFGAFHPRASNSTEDGRRQNRRIEVSLLPVSRVSPRSVRP